MGLKEKMMETMVGRMSAEEKKEMMGAMMEKFFAGMTAEEKGAMMQEMMPRMMAEMMGGTGMGGPMAGMMGMMRSMCRGGEKEDFNPMEMCRRMMAGISNAGELAAFATPEVRALFEEWVRQVDEEVLALLAEDAGLSPEEIAARLRISRESAVYFLSRLARQGRISVRGWTKEKTVGGNKEGDSE